MELYHFSEEPGIARFEPRLTANQPHLPPLVWVVDAWHAPHYWLPRDCPRVTCWADAASRPEDVARLLGPTAARRLIAVESGWLPRIQATRLFIYHLPPGPFTLFDAPAGYYVASQPVEPLRVEPAGDLLARLAAVPEIELRFTPSLWPLQRAVVDSTLQFSIIRLRHARPEGDA